ncbi:MAG: hypothetical protein JSV27_09510 [Candidatus Bathyarchaeota archaeon]|nr:MAG: hypothetical protein JSV27_09510 [Candidatus Bathyarchaeota archaeon]
MVRVLLLDASAFILGYEASEGDQKHYTVTSVLEEVRDDLQRIRLENAIKYGLIRVVSPTPESTARVKSIISELGESATLSRTDTELLALGLQLREEGHEPTVVTDDYSVQNVATRLGLSFKGLGTPGIKRVFEWVIYCPGCRRQFQESQPDGVCPICGTALKRRPGKKVDLNG